MNRLRFIICITTFCLLVFSCDLGEILEKPEESIAYVPQTALAGLHVQDVEGFRSSLQQNELLNQQFLSFYEAHESGFLHPDSLSSWTTEIQDLTVSWHSISGDKLAPLAIMHFNQSLEPSAIEQKLTGLLANEANLTSKYFDDYEVWLLESNGKQWSYLISDNLLVLSTAEILIEDVIRSFNDTDFRLFEKQIVEGLLQNKVFINAPRYNELATKFMKEVAPFVFEEGVMLFDVEVTPKGLLYSGETVGINMTENDNALLFGESFIPLQATELKWQIIEGSREAFIGDFMALASFDVFDQSETLYLLPVEDKEALVQQLDQMAEQAKLPGDSTVYQEEYASQTIGYIGNDFFQKLTRSKEEYLSDGAYYALTNEGLIFSPSAEMLRKSLAAHFDETTYGQSVEKRSFLANLIQDSYFTTIHNFEEGAMNSEQLRPRYADLVEGLLEQLNYFTFQVNGTNSGFLFAGEVSFQTRVKMEKEVFSEEPSLFANALLDQKASTRPFILRNHLTNANEVVLQDAGLQLYQIGLQGSINWKRQLEAQIATDIVQVDYYNNRKLQYLFATDSLVHIIDRNGDEIEGFPKPHGITASINGLSLVDYDNTKRYRYLISAGRGELYLFDKEVRPLENWTPKTLDAQLAVTPFHDRVSGKDFFLAIERSKTIHLLNRMAQEYSGFPINLEQRFSGDQYFKKLPSLATSSVAVISDNGLLKKVNLLGKVIAQKQFLKKDNQDSYRLVNDVLGNGFVILRANKGVATVMMEDETELCTIPLTSNNSSVFYYRLGAGKSVLLVWDEATANVSLFDLKGNKLLQGVRSSYRPSLLYFSRAGNYQLFTNFDSQVRIYQSSAVE